MSENKDDNKLKKIALFCLKNIVNLFFGIAASYYALLAFVLEIAPTENKIMLAGVVVLWLLWLFAKAIITLVFSIIIVLLILYGWYYYNHYDEIVCKNNGGVWNKQEQICEEKVDLWQKIKDTWNKNNFFKISFNKDGNDKKEKDN